MTTEVIQAEYDGHTFAFDAEGWFDATVAADRYGKRPNDFLELDSTIDYIAALDARQIAITGKAGIWKVTRRGRYGGTWLHPKLAVRYAQWLDLNFAIWCDEQIDQILRGAPTSPQAIRAEYLSGYHELHAVVDAKAAESSKPWAVHVNVNKAINKAVGIEPGQRGSLPPGKLALVAAANQIACATFAVASDHHDGYDNAKAALGQFGTLLAPAAQAPRIEPSTHPPPRKRRATKGEAPTAPTVEASIETSSAPTEQAS
ncbi:KilA-N domain-containing protein [Xenophilus sp. Marseille-Q4582]|uniref:KilA-N domain-containing protein n=1 Tax=Xenophilus sp. Marseille-Q4582 TaxID=2866600 RepID=UPI001CE46448|nr:KilA-N domain-containing protein [Xenophilus sp. Marseille-Q4582]